MDQSIRQYALGTRKRNESKSAGYYLNVDTKSLKIRAQIVYARVES